MYWISTYWNFQCIKFLAYQNYLKSNILQFLTHYNITKAENLALENLRKEKDHIIVTAYKGNALVVMDKTEYITKCEALLQDNSVYQHLSKNISPTIHKELIKILQDYMNNNFISETEHTQLRPYESNFPAARFHGLPKNYKTTCLCAHSFSLWHRNIQHYQIHH